MWQGVFGYVQGGYLNNDTRDVGYGASLTLVAVRSLLGDWFGDYTAVSEAVAAMGAPLSRGLATRGEAAALAASSAFAGRIRHLVPHCSRVGVVCNAMGRVVHYAAAAAAAPLPSPGDTAARQDADAGVAVAGIMQLPWLVSVNFALAPVAGQPPAAAELDSDFRLVRFNTNRPILCRCLRVSSSR